MANLFLGIMLTVAGTVLGSIGALLLKRASSSVHRNILLVLERPSLYAGIFLYGISALIFVFALTFGELSVLYPFVALSYVWVAMLSVWLLKEKMNPYKLAGIGFIILGVIFIGIGA